MKKDNMTNPEGGGGTGFTKNGAYMTNNGARLSFLVYRTFTCLKHPVSFREKCSIVNKIVCLNLMGNLSGTVRYGMVPVLIIIFKTEDLIGGYGTYRFQYHTVPRVP
jgi:hypothetical protein